MDPRKIRWRTKLLRVTASSSSPAPGVFVTDLRVIACLLACALIAGFSLVAFAPLLSVRSRLVVRSCCFCSCFFCTLHLVRSRAWQFPESHVREDAWQNIGGTRKSAARRCQGGRFCGLLCSFLAMLA